MVDSDIHTSERAEESEDWIGEADTTGNSESVENHRSDVATPLEAVAVDESKSVQQLVDSSGALRTKVSDELSPDIGLGSGYGVSQLMDHSRSDHVNDHDSIMLAYQRTDSGGSLKASNSHRDSAEAGESVSKSDMEEGNDCRTSSIISLSSNGELRNSESDVIACWSKVSTSDGSLQECDTAALGEEELSSAAISFNTAEEVEPSLESDHDSNEKCRKRTASGTKVDQTPSHALSRSSQSVHNLEDVPSDAASVDNLQNSKRQRVDSQVENAANRNDEDQKMP